MSLMRIPKQICATGITIAARQELIRTKSTKRTKKILKILWKKSMSVNSKHCRRVVHYPLKILLLKRLRPTLCLRSPEVRNPSKWIQLHPQTQTLFMTTRWKGPQAWKIQLHPQTLSMTTRWKGPQAWKVCLLVNQVIHQQIQNLFK